MSKSNIRKDLAIGSIGEDTVRKLIEGLGGTVTKNTERSQLAFWDLKCTLKNLEFTIEVKNDVYAEKTGNIAIEYYNSIKGTPSGLYITKSDLWAHVALGKVFLIPVGLLKQKITENKPYKLLQSVGDGNADIMLYKVKFMLDNFSPLDDMNKTKLQEMVKNAQKYRTDGEPV